MEIANIGLYGVKIIDISHSMVRVLSGCHSFTRIGTSKRPTLVNMEPLRQM